MVPDQCIISVQSLFSSDVKRKFSGLLSFIAAVIAAKDYGMASDFGFSLNGSYYFALVCVFLGCFASAGNVVLAFLDMREQQQAPPPAS